MKIKQNKTQPSKNTKDSRDPETKDKQPEANLRE